MVFRHPDDVVAHLHRLSVRASRDLSDQQLLERFLAGQDEAAFTALVERHGPMVLAVCRRVLRQTYDADDAYQAVFLVLARKAASIRKQASVGSWLHGVALRVARHLKAGLERRRSPERPLIEDPAVTSTTEPTLHEALALLDEELQRLPESYRAPLVLCYLEGKTRDEAAEELGWSPGALHGRLERGRNLRRSRLLRRGLAPSVSLLAVVLSEGTAPAAVPAALTEPLAHLARQFAAGGHGGEMLSLRAASLAAEVVRAMSHVRYQIASLVLLMTALLGTGAGVLAYQARQPQPGAEAKIKPPVKEARPPQIDDNGGRPDLLPVRARWRTLRADVRGVKIDPQGRPWFEIESDVPEIDALRAQVERVCTLSAPWVSGARILLLDRKGRVWIRPRRDWTLLLGYDPSTKRWIERGSGHDIPQIGFLDTVHESKAGRLYFSDRRGVHVLDGDRWSYQPLYKVNLERRLFHDTIEAFDEPHYAEEAGRVFVWTSWGRFGWTGTVGFFHHDGKQWTHRLLHEPKVIKGNESPSNPDLNRLYSVFPLTGDHVVACTQSGAATTMLVRDNKLTPEVTKQVEKDIGLLGDTVFRVRETAHKRLERLGPQVLPLLREGLKRHQDKELLTRLQRLIDVAESELHRPSIDGHQMLHTRVQGVDARGNAWIWFDRCRGPDGQEERTGFRLITREGKVLPAPVAAKRWFPDGMFTDRQGRVYFARYREGCVRFDGDKVIPITDATQTSLRYIQGEDAAGRIYLTDERRIHVYTPDADEARLSLPTTIYDMPWNEHDVALDSHGRLWAFLAPPGGQGKPTMSVFEKGAWRAAPLPDPTRAPEALDLFLPLKNGCLVARDRANRGLFFDGDAWHAYAGVKELIEKRHKQLAQLFDPRQFGSHSRVNLRADSDGRIWYVNWNEESGVWDGRRWLDLLKAVKDASGEKANRISMLLPLPGGKVMLAVDDLKGVPWRISVAEDQMKVARDTQTGARRLDNDYTTRSGMWRDNADRLWLPRDARTSVVIDGKEARVMNDTGFPRFADSRKRVWFLDPVRRKLVVLDAAGRRADLSDDSLGSETLGVAEDGPGSFWVTTEKGLLQVTLTETTAGIVLRRGKHYEKDVPRGACLFFCKDRERNLWFYGPAPDRGSRLYRVQLPPADSGG